MRRLSLLLVGAVLAGTASAQIGWSRYQVLVTNDRDAQRVADSTLELFSESVILGGTDLVVGPGQMPLLIALGLRYRFVSELPNPVGWDKRFPPAREDYRTEYLRYANILAQYEAWRTQYPNNISRTQIATTVANRPVWAYRFFGPGKRGSRTASRSVFVINGIHAREWISPAVGMHVFKTLIDGSLNGGSSSPFPDSTAYYFVPVLNPDGYEYSWTNDRLWRKNRRPNSGGSFGVDLNRNFGTGWGLNGGSSSNQGSSTYRGPAAWSEPEINGLRNFMETIPPVAAFIDFHSYGQYILWPWGYQTTLTVDEGWLSTIGTRMRDDMVAGGGLSYTIGPSASTLYIASGISPDYVYQRFNAPAYTIELRDTGTGGFILPASEIIPTQNEAWNGFLGLVKNMFYRG
jgi:hypothetical protein